LGSGRIDRAVPDVRNPASTKLVALQGVCEVVNEKGRGPVAAPTAKASTKLDRRPAHRSLLGLSVVGFSLAGR